MTELLRLLLVEDSDDDAQLILRAISRGGFELDSQRVETPAGLKGALQDRAWDIIICDYSLPQFTALDALEILRATGLDLPVVIISGTIGEESAVAALKSGAHDFLIKGNLARLVPAIRRELKDAAVRREHREAAAALEKSEERFRSWIEYSSDLVTVADGQGLIEYESHSSEHLLGFPPAELLGKSLYELVHPNDRRDVETLLAPTSQPGDGTVAAEFRLHHRDGTWHDFEGIRRIYQDEQGRLSFIINSRDITERKQRERELEAIASVTVALREARNLGELLSRLLDETLSLVDLDSGSIWLHDTDSGEIYQSVQRSSDPEGSPGFKREQNIARLVVEKGEALAARELSTAAEIGAAGREHFPPGLGGVGVPLRTSESLVGVMVIYTSLPREITAGELRVLTALAEIGGSSIHRMRLFEQSLRQLEQLAALRSIDLAISGSFDLRLSLNTVLEQVIRQLNIDAADILLLGRETQNLKYAYAKGFRGRRIESTHVRLGEGHAGRAALEREAIFIEELARARDTFTRNELVDEEQFVSYYAIPLIAKGRVEGVLEIFNRSRLSPSPEWRDFMEALGGQAAIALDNLSLFRELQQSNYELASAYDATIEGWSHALDLRDRETEGHTQRVTEESLKLARAMNLGDEELVHMKRGALLHDIGKMGVPDSILHKRGPLSESEWKVMRQHPQYAYDMLMPISYLRRALDIPYAHHERWNGAGYPRGLQGEMIPLQARIFAVVDVWDALTTDRPYRAAWPDEKAVEFIRTRSGRDFDPRVVRAFLDVIVDGGEES
ncbi:MAG: HD domain-containing phosphohydrolase [Bacteroidota bacterium]